MQTLEGEIAELKARVAALERELEYLKASASDSVIVLRTISREDAKQEIKQLFQAGETLYFSDIAARLQLDLQLVVEICQELMEEGEIEVDADAI